jgi:uncharacterized protein YvpB
MIRLRRPATVGVGVLILTAAVALPLWTLAQANASHAGVEFLPLPTPTLIAPTSATTTPSISADGSVSLQAPIIKQDLALDCESAALEVALAVHNIDVPQDRIFASLPQDPRAVVRGSNGLPVRWGDPYHAFVGDVNGYEPDFTGYGVYYPPIVAAAEKFGAVAQGFTGWTVAAIEAQVRMGNSVVVWLTSDFKPHVPRFWTAWDGTRVPWAIGEHAVPVIGFDPVQNTITFVDVLYGVERTMSTQAFAAALTTFDGMGVVVS